MNDLSPDVMLSEPSLPVAVLPVALDLELHQRVDAALRSSPYLTRLASGTVRIEASEGHVTLRGSVASFFQKQMAQETLRRLDGVTRVVNELDVVS